MQNKTEITLTNKNLRALISLNVSIYRKNTQMKIIKKNILSRQICQSYTMPYKNYEIIDNIHF
jgi:hypothetical protein